MMMFFISNVVLHVYSYQLVLVHVRVCMYVLLYCVHTLYVCLLLCAYVQDEKYDHLSEEDMGKVREAIETKRQWLNNQMQACSATPLYNDPPVKVNQILSTTKVYMYM